MNLAGCENALAYNDAVLITVPWILSWCVCSHLYIFGTKKNELAFCLPLKVEKKTLTNIYGAAEIGQM